MNADLPQPITSASIFLRAICAYCGHGYQRRHTCKQGGGVQKIQRQVNRLTFTAVNPGVVTRTPMIQWAEP